MTDLIINICLFLDLTIRLYFHMLSDPYLKLLSLHFKEKPINKPLSISLYSIFITPFQHFYCSNEYCGVASHGHIRHYNIKVK